MALEQSLFHFNYNKHSNQLTKSYKSVNDEHIQSPGPQAATSTLQLVKSPKKIDESK